LWKLQEVPYVFFNEAVQLSRKGDYIEAIQKVLASISLNPDFVDAYILLGNLYQEEKHEKEARGCFEKALSLLPETETELKRQLYSFLETRPVTKIKPKIRAFL